MILLILTLLLSVSNAQELWKSLSPIGKGSIPEALNIVEDYSNLFNNFVFNHHLDDHTELVFKKIKQHTFELNSKKLYRTLKPKGGHGRYLHGRGNLQNNRYFFSLDDERQKQMEKGPFGSTHLIYEANLRENTKEDIYDMFIGYNFYLKNITYKNIYLSLFDFKNKIENNLSDIDKNFGSSFPHFKSRFSELASLKFKGTQSKSHLKTKVELNLDMTAFKEYQYGYIHRYLDDLSDIFIGEIKIYNSRDQLLGTLSTNSARKKITLEMAFGHNTFLPLDPKYNTKVDLISPGENTFKLLVTGMVKIFDIGIDVNEYIIPVRYSYDHQMSSFHFEFNKMPQFHIHGTKITGPIISILKKVFTIEDKIKNFFNILSKGLNSTPSSLTVSYFDKNDIIPETLYFKSNLSILDNTLLKMGFKLISKRVLPDEFEKEEILTLTKEFHHAFINDFKRAKKLLISEI